MDATGLHSTVAVMCCLFSHLLVVLDDAEIYEKGQPLPLHHVRALVKGLKRPLFAFCWNQVREREGGVGRGVAREKARPREDERGHRARCPKMHPRRGEQTLTPL